MSQPTPSDSLESSSADAPNSNINVSGGNFNVGGDLVGGDKYVIAEESAYDVRGCENPYLGLSAFTYADAKKYAGREKLIAETVARIPSPTAPISLLFITGASGSGKSSFAQAGLLPALEKFYQGFDVKHAVMRPAGDPLAALNDALWRQLRVGQNSEVSDNFGILNATPPNQINLLVLDQFEEFFTQAPQTAREQFFAWIAELPPFAQTRTHIIATMRADYLPELFDHPALYDIAKRGVDLRAMNAEELMQAIQKPLLASPYAQTKKFEPSLAEKLAYDAAQDATYLPLLQVTLQEIWRKGFLKLAAYTNLTDAIKQRADQVLEYRDFDDAVPDEKRDPAQQTAMLSLLLDLVDVSLDDDARRDVRRQRTKTELTRGNPQRERWVKQLSDARLLSVEREADDDARVTVDLIHETLLTNWTRLQSVIAERRSELRRRARFEQNLDEWLTIKLSAQNRADEYLLEGVRLAEARELEARDDVALRNEDAKAYLRASVAQAEAEQQAGLERERQRAEALERAKREAEKSAAAEKLRVQEQMAANTRLRRRNLYLAGAFVLALIAAGAALFFLTQSNANLRDAESRRLAAQSITKREDDLGLSYLLGIEAFKKSETFEALRNLFTLRFQDPYLKGFLWGHANYVTNVVSSPNGEMLASVECKKLENKTCAASEIFLWDVESKERIGVLSGHTDIVSSVAFSPDGKILATGSCKARETNRSCKEGELFLWDTATQQRIGELQGTPFTVWRFVFSPDGKALAAWGCEKRDASATCTGRGIFLWNVENQQEIGKLELPTASIYSAAFSPDGKTLAGGSCAEWDEIGYCIKGKIFLWDFKTKQSIGEMSGHTGKVSDVTFSPDGKLLASGSNGTVLLWNMKTQESIADVPVALEGDKVTFSPDGKTLLTRNEETVQWWNVSALLGADLGAQPLIDEKKIARYLAGIAFSPDGRVLGAGGLDNMIALWDFTTQARIEVKGAPLSSVALDSDGKVLASGDLDGKIWFWDVTTRHPLRDPLVDGDSRVQTITYSPDGKVLASGNWDGVIRLWNVETQQPIGELRGHKGMVWQLAFSWDGKLLASAGQDGTIRLWDLASAPNNSLATKEPVAVLQGHTSDVVSIAFSRDNRTLASGSFDDQIGLWDVEKRQPIRMLNHQDDVMSVTFSPDGKTLASGSSDNTIRLWKVGTWEQVGELPGVVQSLVYSPDGKILASGELDGVIRLWNIGTRQAIGELQKSMGSIAPPSIIFFPTGKILVSWSDWGDGIDLWDMDVQSWLASACKIVNRNLTRAEYAQYINSNPTAYDGDYAKNPTCPELPIEPLATPTPNPTP
ncbi:MAG: hypothetical protein EYC68_03410 [Chloroflexota bacterium]|nr:MAG: hypothetical protein EYC68_03410 [Chloroflexota bacterium]